MLVAYAAFVYFELSNSCRRDEACQVSLMTPFSSAHYLFIPLQVSEVLLCAFYQGGSGDQGDDDYDYAYPEISKWEAIAWLAIFTAWISVFSGYLVDAIEVLYLSNLTSDVS
jgi:Ca2+:H+ antiporter